MINTSLSSLRNPKISDQLTESYGMNRDLYELIISNPEMDKKVLSKFFFSNNIKSKYEPENACLEATKYIYNFLDPIFKKRIDLHCNFILNLNKGGQSHEGGTFSCVYRYINNKLELGIIIDIYHLNTPSGFSRLFHVLYHELTHVEQVLKRFLDTVEKNKLPEQSEFTNFLSVVSNFNNRYADVEPRSEEESDLYIKDRMEIGAFAKQTAEEILHIIRDFNEVDQNLLDPTSKYHSILLKPYANYLSGKITKSSFYLAMIKYLSTKGHRFNWLTTRGMGSNSEDRKKFIQLLIKDLDPYI